MLRTLAVLLVGFIAATTANQSQVVMPLSELLEAMNCTSHTDGECMRGYSVTALTKKRALKRTYTSQKHQSHARSPYSNTKGASHNTRRAFNQEQVPLIRLTRDVLSPQRYDVRARPVVDHRTTLSIHVSMSLYQIIDVNEPSQNVKMNVWMIQKWRDESLNWDPRDYSMINTTILPHNVLWVPDTYLYNSVVMSADETERYMNIRVDSLFWEGRRGANMSFLYPAIYTVTCKLNIRYFPYDQQNCTLTIGSWTNSKSTVDYYADEHVNMASYIENGEWDVMSFRIFRHEYKYACCPEPWVILEASIILRRKPLYYVINLIIPTSIITLVAITGFFTPASTADDRTEKINLGITTLLAMSILMLMISDAMPTTSEFVPLIAWFYLSIIIIISIGTFLTSVILGIQSRRQYGELPPLIVRYWLMCRIRELLCMRVPPQLALIWDELNDHPLMAYHNPDCKEDSNTEDIILQKHDDSIDENVVTFCGDSARTLPPVERKIRSALIRQARQCGESNIATRPLSTLKPKRSRGGEIHASFKRNNGNRVRLNWQRVVNAVVQQENKAENAGNEVASSFDDSDNCNAAIVNPRPSLNVPMIDTATPCASPPLSTSPLNTSANLLTPTLPDKTSLFFAASPCISPVQLLTPTPSPKQPTFLVAPKRKMQSPGQNSTWGMAMTALGMTAHRKSTGSVAPCVPSGGGVSMPKLGVFSPEVAEMRRRRQCSLEWEFISTLLDRLFLILFTFTVLSVTAALMITGRIAQVQYENS